MTDSRPAGLTNDLIWRAVDIDLEHLPMIDTHLHTSWTDGEASVEDMYEAALNMNLKTILFSEHSRKTSTDWFRSFADEVKSLPLVPCRAYVGTEVKVETLDGDIDTVAEISDQCDFIMASVHRFIDPKGETMLFADTDPNEAVDLEYRLTWAALENPLVDILGHMFGMSYRRFNVIPPDHKIVELIERAAKFGVAVEVNSHYHPDPLKVIDWCRQCDALITFGSNAHSLSTVGEIVRMIKQAKQNG
jgi:histidinol phosphatase-like PHP family hydrolase